MDEVSLNGEPVYEDEVDGYEIEGDCGVSGYGGQTGIIQGENPLPPAVGMEFDSYDDVYYFYTCYAKDQGFGVRVSNTWYRKSRERYRGKLSCSSAGFKKKSEANRPRPETRTGCPAMIKLRLMDTGRWRIIEVELEHNHLLNLASGKFFKSYKHIGVGSKRALQLESIEDEQKIRLFRTVIVDAEFQADRYVDKVECEKAADQVNRWKFREGDVQAIHDYFCGMQLSNPNFFYLMDLNEKGCLKNVFWSDAKSKAAYKYFDDVIAINTTCMSEQYEVPFVAFIGLNHHGQPIILGCGLLAGETMESYIWLFRAWLTFMLGRPPAAIITMQCRTLQAAVSDVFPRAFHCLSLSHIMQKFRDQMGGFHQYEALDLALNNVVFQSIRIEEFEVAWEDMIQRNGLKDHEWFQALYEYRKNWAPVYLKETFLLGMFPVHPHYIMPSPLNGYLQKHTPLKVFFEKYDETIKMSHREETMADLESRDEDFVLSSRCYFELQLSKMYTHGILKKFLEQVQGMYSCFSVRQMNVDGPITSYVVKENTEIEKNRTEMQDYEVLYNPSEGDVHCACGLFNLKGYLCRHALNVLSQNGVEEIPPQYILSRWRKDIKRSYILDQGCNGIDTDNPIHRYDHLYKCVMQVVEEAAKSQTRRELALRELDEIFSKVHLIDDHPIKYAGKRKGVKEAI